MSLDRFLGHVKSLPVITKNVYIRIFCSLRSKLCFIVLWSLLFCLLAGSIKTTTTLIVVVRLAISSLCVETCQIQVKLISIQLTQLVFLFCTYLSKLVLYFTRANPDKSKNQIYSAWEKRISTYQKVVWFYGSISSSNVVIKWTWLLSQPLDQATAKNKNDMDKSYKLFSSFLLSRSI